MHKNFFTPLNIFEHSHQHADECNKVFHFSIMRYISFIKIDNNVIIIFYKVVNPKCLFRMKLWQIFLINALFLWGKEREIWDSNNNNKQCSLFYNLNKKGLITYTHSLYFLQILRQRTSNPPKKFSCMEFSRNFIFCHMNNWFYPLNCIW